MPVAASIDGRERRCEPLNVNVSKVGGLHVFLGERREGATNESVPWRAIPASLVEGLKQACNPRGAEYAMLENRVKSQRVEKQNSVLV